MFEGFKSTKISVGDRDFFILICIMSITPHPPISHSRIPVFSYSRIPVFSYSRIPVFPSSPRQANTLYLIQQSTIFVS